LTQAMKLAVGTQLIRNAYLQMCSTCRLPIPRVFPLLTFYVNRTHFNHFTDMYFIPLWYKNISLNGNCKREDCILVLPFILP